MHRDNVNCEWHFMEPDCRKCLLLGYHYTCGSKECEEAKDNVRKDNKTPVPYRRKGENDDV